MRIRLLAFAAALSLSWAALASPAGAQGWRWSDAAGWVWDEPGGWHQSAAGAWIYCWYGYSYVDSEGVNDWRWGWSCAAAPPA